MYRDHVQLLMKVADIKLHIKAIFMYTTICMLCNLHNSHITIYNNYYAYLYGKCIINPAKYNVQLQPISFVYLIM